jgi:hypothetical protein
MLFLALKRVMIFGIFFISPFVLIIVDWIKVFHQGNFICFIIQELKFIIKKNSNLILYSVINILFVNKYNLINSIISKRKDL